MLGGASCLAPGVLCAVDGRACGANGETYQCINCGGAGPTCEAEAVAGCQCLNFDHTGPGTTLVCEPPPPCSGPRCG